MSASNGVLIAAGWRRRQLNTMIRRQLTCDTKNARLIAKKATLTQRGTRHAEPASPNTHFYVDSYTATHFNFTILYKIRCYGTSLIIFKYLANNSVL